MHNSSVLSSVSLTLEKHIYLFRVECKFWSASALPSLYPYLNNNAGDKNRLYLLSPHHVFRTAGNA